MPKRAFAVVAHPDDIEFMMAGTLILLRRAGYELHYMTVANGSCGSITEDAATIARIRRRESMDAAGLLGAIYHESLCDDLEIFYDKPTLQRLGSVMREVAPDIILTHPPQDYMEDHMNTCRLVLTAAFARGIPNFPVQPPHPPVDGPVAIYHALPYGLRDPLGRSVSPGMYVDVTEVMESKRAALAMHRSQKEWLDASQGIDSYLNHMEAMTREVGRMSGRYAYAEGWTQRLYLGYGPPDVNPLAEALGELTFIPE